MKHEGIEALCNEKEYLILTIGKEEFEGSLILKKDSGENIKKDNHIIENLDNIIYPIQKENDSIIKYKISDFIEHQHYKNMKEQDFFLYGKDKEGNEFQDNIKGNLLCKTLTDLLDNKKELTIVSKNSHSYSFFEPLKKIPRQKGTIYFSEMSDLQKAKFCLDNDYKTDPFNSEQNVYEHKID